MELHVLRRAGSPSARPELAKGFAWLRSHQRTDGSWPGRSVNKERDPATFIGPLISQAQRGRVEAAIASGRDSGAKVVLGGGRPTHVDAERGWYVDAVHF